jgi:hypothetical protein
MVELTDDLRLRVLPDSKTLTDLDAKTSTVFVVDGVPANRAIGAVVAKLAGTLSPLVRVDMILGTIRPGRVALGGRRR